MNFLLVAGYNCARLKKKYLEVSENENVTLYEKNIYNEIKMEK